MAAPDAPANADHLEQVAGIVDALRALGLDPVLVGGMALVVLGSRRVTRGFDFVLCHPGERLHEVVDALYDRGFELVARLDAAGEVRATIGNRAVAAARLRIDAVEAASFFDPKTRSRVDLLFDFPFPAAAIAAGARRIKVRSHAFLVASEHDLLRMKRAAAARRKAGDAEDIAFLQARARAKRLPR